jgi:hypothetical protein
VAFITFEKSFNGDMSAFGFVWSGEEVYRSGGVILLQTVPHGGLRVVVGV